MLNLPPTLAFHTPLLKLPLLLGNAIYTYKAFPSPQASAANEKTRCSALHQLALATSKYFCCGVSLIEAALIVGHHPSWTYSAYIPTSLLPFLRLWSLRLTWTSVAGCTLGIVGGIIRAQCRRALRRPSSAESSAEGAGNLPKLITDGPYSVVRHPDYLGECLIVGGNVLLLASRGSWFTEGGLWKTFVGKGVACSVIAFLASVAFSRLCLVGKEEEVLRKEFGQQWDEWASKTPYRLIPFIY